MLQLRPVPRRLCSGALDDQPGSDVRVLIIDDASQDDSAEIARKLAAADDRIEVRVHSVNRGHIATFNEGLLDWADGDYCVLISADDRLAPGRYAGQLTSWMRALRLASFTVMQWSFATARSRRPPDKMPLSDDMARPLVARAALQGSA